MRYRLIIVAATIIWGSSFVIVKDVTNMLPPAWILVIRFAVAAALLALAFVKRRNLYLERSHVGFGLLFGVAMFVLAFFFGDKLAALFVSDPAIIAAAFEYLKSYGIDCLLTCFMFILIGFLNGMEMTRFVMIQGILGAFFVRVPISFLMSKQEPVSLFHIGLATPASSAVQIVICLIALLWLRKKINAEKTGASTKSRT